MNTILSDVWLITDELVLLFMRRCMKVLWKMWHGI